MSGIPPPVQTLLDEFIDVFPDDIPARLPPDRGTDHTIPLEPGAKPVFRPMYRLSPLEITEAKKQITEYQAKGWIVPSYSPYGQPILFVFRMFGTLCRYCDSIEKYTFMQENLLYLRHEVGPGGIRPDKDKLSVIPAWPTPKNVKDVRSFSGLAKYCRKFIYACAKIAKPMTNLTKASTHFEWTQQCLQAFDRLKYCLTHTPILAIFDPMLLCKVVTDASKHSLGGVLLQGNRAIAYESRTMNGAEQRYGVGEQELLATVHYMRKWRCYLEGAHSFVVVADHNPNVFLRTKTELSRRQARWSELLQSYDFWWEYRLGRTNLADSLSRIDGLVPLPTSVTATPEPERGREGRVRNLPDPTTM